jgi:hypothetical protein
MKKFGVFLGITTLILSLPAIAQGPAPSCTATDKACILQEIETTAGIIDTPAWKDKAYRELAKSYTYEGMEDKAIALIPKIESPDTKAMTIRGIGFAAADSKWETGRYIDLWEKLQTVAAGIDHPASHGIALTYIAMAQAFAGQDEAATATALSMENPALKNKALGESAEIQAERGDFAAAMASIGHIQDAAFRNKAYAVIPRYLYVKTCHKKLMTQRKTLPATRH